MNHYHQVLYQRMLLLINCKFVCFCLFLGFVVLVILFVLVVVCLLFCLLFCFVVCCLVFALWWWWQRMLSSQIQLLLLLPSLCVCYHSHPLLCLRTVTDNPSFFLSSSSSPLFLSLSSPLFPTFD